MFIIVMRQHGALNCETKYFGPYADHDTAYDALSDGSIPSLYKLAELEARGIERANGHRFIAELESAQ
jgi:hypothetical protein